MAIAAGEYGYHLDYFRRMLEAGAVDVLQADTTRCGGFTGFLQVATLCEAHHISLSSHCAPALHVHVGCATPALRHAEYFHDHVRIEQMIFDGVTEPSAVAPLASLKLDRLDRSSVGLRPDLTRPGLGLILKRADAEKFAI